ncbi:MAG TPA: hypothetical protein C5S51_04180 [Methanosarcinaceae archaeon]|nr:hypothetical protein [Methanosarcinaceae archaeon]
MKKMDDSAQLVLIAGFTIGLAIVVSTIMLNNIIFASNMASESSIDANRYYVSNIRQMSSDALSGAYGFATKNQTSFNATLFNQYMSGYNHKAASVYALSGVSFNVRNSNFYDGYFTENGLLDGDSDWIVMADVNSTDSLLIEINDTSVLGNATNAFTVQAINSSGSSLWLVKLYNDSGNVNISVYDQNMSAVESGTSSGFLNITNDLVDGDDSFDFHFNDYTVNETYKLKFLNGTNAAGYFSMSGNLTDGTSFSRVRYKMTNATVSTSSGKTRINVSIPISIP